MLLSLPPQILNPNWKNCATTSFPTMPLWRCAARTRGRSSSLLARALPQPAYTLLSIQPCAHPCPSHIHEHSLYHLLCTSASNPELDKSASNFSTVYFNSRDRTKHFLCFISLLLLFFFLFTHARLSQISGFSVVPSEERFAAIFSHWGFISINPILFIFFMKNNELQVVDFRLMFCH